jgi:hypothetical protein
MTEHEEQLAALRASIDQIVASAGEMVRALGAYMTALIEEGFTREEAVRVCIAWQTTLLTKKPEDE